LVEWVRPWPAVLVACSRSSWVWTLHRSGPNRPGPRKDPGKIRQPSGSSAFSMICVSCRSASVAPALRVCLKSRRPGALKARHPSGNQRRLLRRAKLRWPAEGPAIPP